MRERDRRICLGSERSAPASLGVGGCRVVARFDGLDLIHLGDS